MLFLLRGARDAIVGLGDVVSLVVLLLVVPRLVVIAIGLEIEGRLDAAVRVGLGILDRRRDFQLRLFVTVHRRPSATRSRA